MSKLSELPTWTIRQILRATERDVGPDSQAATMLRRELLRRDADHGQAAGSPQPEEGER